MSPWEHLLHDIALDNFTFSQKVKFIFGHTHIYTQLYGIVPYVCVYVHT
jgi:hypothetical protein